MVCKILGLINLTAAIYIFPKTGSMGKHTAEVEDLNLLLILYEITEEEL